MRSPRYRFHLGRLIRRLALVLLVTGAVMNASSAEQTLDTGRIKVVFGKAGGGFLDEVSLDLNGDGKYADDEKAALRPDAAPGVIVEYAAIPDGYQTGSVLTGKRVAATVAVKEARVDVKGEVLTGVVTGKLDFKEWGSTPFTATIEGKKGSAALVCGLEFKPLPDAGKFALISAGLRAYGNYLPYGKPKGARGLMSVAGTFRNTPRPKSSYQPLTWQLGGRLVESPFYWRDWKSWSEASSPLTYKQGNVPDRFLDFYMYGPHKGMIAALKHPALTAPNELFGHGQPSSITAYAWPPHVPPLDMRGRKLPDQFHIRNVGFSFFPVVPGKVDRYFYKAATKNADAERNALKEGLKPLETNLVDPRMPEALIARAKESLAGNKKTGWDLEKSAPPPPVSGAIKPEVEVSGDGWVAVRVDANYALPVKQAPICGGVALPKGACKSADQAVLLGMDDKEIPAQLDPVAYWPDTSVKWLLIQAFVDIAAKKALHLKLAFGADKKASAKPAAQLKVEKTETSCTVDTGAIRFTLSKGNSGFLDTVWLDANGDGTYGDDEKIVDGEKDRRRNFMDLARTAKVDGYEPFSFSASALEEEHSTAKVEDVVIERQGPISVDLCVKGRYQHKKLSVGLSKRKNKGSEFWVRVTAYAGKPYLKIKHTYVYEGNPDLEHIQSLGVAFKPLLGDAATLIIGDEAKNVAAPMSAGTTVGVVHDNPQHYAIWKHDGKSKHTKVESVGRSAPGWIDLSDGKRGVTLGMRHMREMHARELACEDGSLAAYTWPKRARLLDTRRYSRQWGAGESTAWGMGMAIGVSRTTDLFVAFHAGKGEPAALSQVFNDPPIVMNYPDWYASTEVFGPFHVYDLKRFPKLESCMENWLDYWLYCQRLWSWYGIYDFGDLQSVNRGGGNWAYDDGRWGWINNEALVDMAFWLQFFRTGRRDYYRLAEACSLHVAEVDLINSTQYKTGQNAKMKGHRHNVNHWGDGYVGSRVNASTGFKLEYYLTGDLRMKDLLEMIVVSNRSRLGTYNCGGDVIGARVSSLLYKWEATGEQEYLDALKAFIEWGCDYAEQKNRGVFPYSAQGWDFKQNKHFGGKRVGGHSGGMFFQNFGAGHTLNEFVELTGHERLKKSIIATARTIHESRSWHSGIGLWPLQAAAYRYSHDKRFADWIWKVGTKSWINANRKAWSTQKCVASMGKCMFGAWLTHGMPYYMYEILAHEGAPQPGFGLPSVVRIPEGQQDATVTLDASASKKGKAELKTFEWFLDGKPTAQGAKAEVKLTGTTREVALRVTDADGKVGACSRGVTVWPSETAANICFTVPAPRGFVIAPRTFNEKLGFGFVGKVYNSHTSEPRPQFDRGCKCRRVTGTLRIKAEPGTYVLEMGATDWWSTSSGPVKVQGKAIEKKVVQKDKKHSWTYAADVTLGADGTLEVVFGEGKAFALISYVVLKRK